MTYKFYYQIMNEDDEEVIGGNTTIGTSISEMGENEAVEMEVSRAMRLLKNFIQQEEDDEELKRAEEDGSEDGVDLLQDKE